MTRVLIARITLRDGCGNGSQLDVRKAENDELVLSYFGGGTALSLSNLQPKSPPPAFCLGEDADTVDMVVRWVTRTLVTIEHVERGPSALRPGEAVA